ncbi:phosphatase PAP2 family protein [Paucilactobacillus hokkaidonensis]|uniref:phosphatase PAP2 family protein n=1 Tax=Paucilactobacillus hokkaidonensis TaxID=1193095 RepID=UPI0006D17BFE|nr:phosphatase PAP2 family protein [Paucilactobacillus hokkaidonensis]
MQRPRPIGQLVKDTGFSYPSGHTFSTAILILTILFIIVPLLEDQEVQLLVSLLAIIWIIIIAFSRIYLRNHFPTDVLAGLLLAVSWWEIMRAAYFYYLESNFQFFKS